VYFSPNFSTLPSDKEFDQLLVFHVPTKEHFIPFFTVLLSLCFALKFFSFVPPYGSPSPHSSFPHRTETTSSLPRQQPPSELLFLKKKITESLSLSLTISFVFITLSHTLFLTPKSYFTWTMSFVAYFYRNSADPWANKYNALSYIINPTNVILHIKLHLFYHINMLQLCWFWHEKWNVWLSCDFATNSGKSWGKSRSNFRVWTLYAYVWFWPTYECFLGQHCWKCLARITLEEKPGISKCIFKA